MNRKQKGWFGAVSFLILSGMVAGCATPVARSMVIVPGPRDTASVHAPALSRVAAARVRREIEERGYSAIYPGSTLAPESLSIAEDASGGADLTLFVWVQQVDIPRLTGSGDPVTWGGIDLRDRGDKRLAYSSGLLKEPGRPSNDLHTVAAPDDPRAVRAADEFGARALGSTREFSRKVGPLLSKGR